MSEPVEDKITYAWCFDHGVMHRFGVDPWCTAAWVDLHATDDTSALRQKETIWGAAQFFDQLALDRQGGLINIMDARKGPRGSGR